jgi:ubiquinone/menaquinone biosynthesis C-methylase UbiE
MKTTLKTKQESIKKVFDKLLTEYELTELEIGLLYGIQGIFIERLVKDGKLKK